MTVTFTIDSDIPDTSVEIAGFLSDVTDVLWDQSSPLVPIKSITATHDTGPTRGGAATPLATTEPLSDVVLEDWEEYIKHTWGTRSFMADMHQKLVAEIRRLRKELKEVNPRKSMTQEDSNKMTDANATWCQYCNERAAEEEVDVTTGDGMTAIAVCRPCKASINENGYAAREYIQE